MNLYYREFIKGTVQLQIDFKVLNQISPVKYDISINKNQYNKLYDKPDVENYYENYIKYCENKLKQRD